MLVPGKLGQLAFFSGVLLKKAISPLASSVGSGAGAALQRLGELG